MDFINFCHAHGILITHPPSVGVWKRYPTTDHPKSRNGAVKFMGDHAFVQNHAIDTDVSVWKSDSSASVDMNRYLKLARDADQKRIEMQKLAMNNAAGILKDCRFGKHPYLKSKGFQDEEGNVFIKDGSLLLVIPMRVHGALVGLQIIDEDGRKKFLFGQRTSGAQFCFDNKGSHILCEGYATALSVRQALKSVKKRYTLHVCFSAGNMKKVAESLKPDSGIVIADNDESKTGERVAQEIGWPYWMSDQVGEDANDYHQRVGLFKFAMVVNGLLNRLTMLDRGDDE